MFTDSAFQAAHLWAGLFVLGGLVVLAVAADLFISDLRWLWRKITGRD